MNIRDLAAHNDIVIQCHDIPDADTIASGFALFRYLKWQGCSPRLIYSGRSKISKPNLTLMVRLLNIPLEYVEYPAPCLFLVTVDCQHGAGNVSNIKTLDFAVIDHHRAEIPEEPAVYIRPSVGSCSTLIWDMMARDGFDFASAPEVFTALYYGLYTDTNGFAEIHHPLDRDMREFMPFDRPLVKRLKNSALTMDELDIVADALSEPLLLGNVGLAKARPCDPNILGFSSDIVQQVEQFDACVVFCPLEWGIKLSIRSSVREIMAHEFAAFISRDVGSGGGNIEKAGAFLSYADIEKINPGIEPEEFLRQRIEKYNKNYDYIYPGNNDLDFAAMTRYRKLPLPVGFVRTIDVFPENTPICIRTLEGDIDIFARPDIYLMIGVAGEIYPISREKFEQSYYEQDMAYAPVSEYPPTIIDKVIGKRKSVLPFVQSCIPAGKKYIRAALLTRDTKVFSEWDTEKYYYGSVGDYIAAPESDFRDVYIIRDEIFNKTYVKE